MTEENIAPRSPAANSGAMLRQARLEAGLDVEQVSQLLKVPARIVNALELGQWGLLGAPVFVRGHLRSYARLLKVDIEPYLDGMEASAVRPPSLVSRSHTPVYQRLFEGTARRAVYVVITLCFFAVPMWLAMRGPALQTTASLDEVPMASSPAKAVTATSESSAQTFHDQAHRSGFSPLVASMAPPLSVRNASEPTQVGLRFSFHGDSWVRVEGTDGVVLEKGLLKSGDVREFASGQVLRVVLGNAAAVDVQHAGGTVSLDPYQRGNVARFTVSPEGALVPVQ